MTIQDKLDSLTPYVVGIRYVQGVQLVETVFKDGWTIPDSDVIKKEKVDGENNYYMFFTDNADITIDDLLTYVEGIIGINVEREKKHELLREKVKELQIIFKDNPLSKLNRLKFTFNDEDLVPSLLNMDNVDLIEETKPPVETKPKPPVAPVNKEVVNTPQTKNINGQNIELPPKGEKIELENHELPTSMTEGECDCGENQACSKCMDSKSMS